MIKNKNYTLVGTSIVVALLAGIYFYKQVFAVPASFPVGKNFTVNENESLRSISFRLEDGGYIYSPLLFRAGVSFLGKDRSIVVGGYVFDSPTSLLGVIEMFVKGRPTYPLLSITIPEGSTSFEIAMIVAKALPGISTTLFTQVIDSYNANGRLFPSTYFLLPSHSAEDIVKIMLSTFTKKASPVTSTSKIPSPLKDENEVIILASILEGEANTEKDMKIIAGILLTRLSIGMPLQVDVATETYKVRGLPKNPINNPGLVAIQAVLNPTMTPYLYYITGNDGNMYYAETFPEHRKNIIRYLK